MDQIVSSTLTDVSKKWENPFFFQDSSVSLASWFVLLPSFLSFLLLTMLWNCCWFSDSPRLLDFPPPPTPSPVPGERGGIGTVRVSDLEPSEYQATLVGWTLYCKQQHRLYLAQLVLYLLNITFYYFTSCLSPWIGLVPWVPQDKTTSLGSADY